MVTISDRCPYGAGDGEAFMSLIRRAGLVSTPPQGPQARGPRRLAGGLQRQRGQRRLPRSAGRRRTQDRRAPLDLENQIDRQARVSFAAGLDIVCLPRTITPSQWIRASAMSRRRISTGLSVSFCSIGDDGPLGISKSVHLRRRAAVLPRVPAWRRCSRLAWGQYSLRKGVAQRRDTGHRGASKPQRRCGASPRIAIACISESVRRRGSADRAICCAQSARRVLASGANNRQIASQLFLAEGTVKNYVSAILGKLGVQDRTQAALRARELGLLKPGS